ncbi:MAG: hypothetical protein Alpg2KO_33050 [Alphaproteobacteria bacterium]
MDLPGKLGEIAKDAEKISERDTLRMIREVMSEVQPLLPGTDEDNPVRNQCRIHVEHLDNVIAGNDAEPGSRRYNLVLLHSMLTVEKAAEQLTKEKSYPNAQDLCMLAYRRGRQFLPEDMRPSTTKPVVLNSGERRIRRPAQTRRVPRVWF